MTKRDEAIAVGVASGLTYAAATVFGSWLMHRMYWGSKKSRNKPVVFEVENN